MSRRRALVVAATLAASVTLAGGAAAANLGLLRADHDQVGDLTVTDLQPDTPSADHHAITPVVVRTPPAAHTDDDEGELEVDDD